MKFLDGLGCWKCGLVLLSCWCCTVQICIASGGFEWGKLHVRSSVPSFQALSSLEWFLACASVTLSAAAKKLSRAVQKICQLHRDPCSSTNPRSGGAFRSHLGSFRGSQDGSTGPRSHLTGPALTCMLFLCSADCVCQGLPSRSSQSDPRAAGSF